MAKFAFVLEVEGAFDMTHDLTADRFVATSPHYHESAGKVTMLIGVNPNDRAADKNAAHERLERLHDEIYHAMAKGSFSIWNIETGRDEDSRDPVPPLKLSVNVENEEQAAQVSKLLVSLVNGIVPALIGKNGLSEEEIGGMASMVSRYGNKSLRNPAFESSARRPVSPGLSRQK